MSGEQDADTRTIGRLLAQTSCRNGSKALLKWQGTSFSYAEAEHLTNRYANGFADLGVVKGDHVAVLLSNKPEFLWTVWGLGKLGAVVVPINTNAKGDLLAYFLNQSDTSWLVLGEEWVPRALELGDHLPHLRAIILDGTGANVARDLSASGLSVVSLRSLEEASPSPPPVDAVAGTDPAYIMFTSGTTGPSKGVISPQSQAVGVGAQVAQSYGYTSDDVLYTCLPLFHANALWYTCYAALQAEATFALSSRFSATTFWDEIRRSRATEFNLIGTMANVIIKQPPNAADRDHNVRISLIAPAPADLVRTFRERYGIQVVSGFAATETFLVTISGPNAGPAKAGSAGTQSPGAEVRVVDEAGQPVAAGIAGEILVRSDDPGLMMTGYYKMPEATEEALRGGWFHTGDRGYLDEDGCLFFMDRIKDAIRRRGENISAHEVETLVAQHPQVLEVAAIPVPSELGEDDVMVYVVPQPGITIDPGELVRFCDDHMAYFMVPRFVAMIEALPKTPNTRVEKYKLKQWAQERRDELWDREQAGIKLSR